MTIIIGIKTATLPPFCLPSSGKFFQCHVAIISLIFMRTRIFCKWFKSLKYSKLIIVGGNVAAILFWMNFFAFHENWNIHFKLISLSLIGIRRAVKGEGAMLPLFVMESSSTSTASMSPTEGGGGVHRSSATLSHPRDTGTFPPTLPGVGEGGWEAGTGYHRQGVTWPDIFSAIGH